MADRTPLVAANWKMNGTRASAGPLVEAVVAGLVNTAGIEVVICPPAVYLAEISGRLQGGHVMLGAQTVSEHDDGAYTGEVSATMLKDYNCRFVIVGHSERRHLFAESDVHVAHKMTTALAAGLVPIVCVGEQLGERESGATEAVIERQLAPLLRHDAFAPAVIAYEPVWAIGTGRTATPEQAQEVHAFIRARLDARHAGLGAQTRILYGGSVKPGNAAELFAMPDIDGGLIGGASLNANDFLAICQSVKT